MNLLENKIALITGAARGIGRRTAELFAEEGATVIVTDLKETDSSVELMEKLKAINPDCSFYTANAADWAQTEALAKEVAERFNGYVTEINYKTRESATRKCKTDNSRPYDLKDLARTTIVAGWDSTEIKPVISYLVSTATGRNVFGRYKHQTSDYGYWGDIVNLKFVKLMTEVQVKTYGMFYASHPEDYVRSVIGDSLYTVIHDKIGVEPNLSHYYYEIMRADTSSAATIAYYKQLAIEYHYLCDHIKD